MPDETNTISPPREDFSDFARSQYPVLVGVLAIVLGDRWTAQDVAQEALARAWSRWHRVGSLDRPDLWTKHVALNLARSRWRHQRVVARAEGLATEAENAPGSGANDEVLHEAVRRLPARQRAAIAFRYFDGMTVAEAASAMGCKEGTVRALTAQAVSSLRERLVIRGEVEDD